MNNLYNNFSSPSNSISPHERGNESNETTMKASEGLKKEMGGTAGDCGLNVSNSERE